MKPYKGYKSEPSGIKKIDPLPAGAYVAKVKAVKIDGQEPDQALIIRLDVCEGEYTGYFMQRYMQESKRANGKYEPRYRGDYRIRIPNDENTKAMYPESDERNFNNMTYRFESSNPGYHWDWNEQSLVGLVVGINMQQDEFNDVPFTRIGRLETADDVRKGLVKAMPPRKRKGDAYDGPIDQQSGYVQVNTEEIPF